jgi:hypothetical protein
MTAARKPREPKLLREAKKVKQLQEAKTLISAAQSRYNASFSALQQGEKSFKDHQESTKVLLAAERLHNKAMVAVHPELRASYKKAGLVR